MSESLHNTATPDAPQPVNQNLFGEFKKLIPTIVLAILTALVTSWLNSQKLQGDFQHRIEMLEKRAETNAANISKNSTALQQNAIRLAELSILQNNALEQVKDLKQEQAEITVMLRK